MKPKLIVVIACFCMLSCKQKSNIEELLAGKEYKYWIQVSKHGIDTVLVYLDRISYYDREYKSLGYFYNNRFKEFYMPEFDDVFYYPYWKLINDTIIDVRGCLLHIKTLTETDLILKVPCNGKVYHYKAAPLEIIPKEYQCVQPIPKALQFID